MSTVNPDRSSDLKAECFTPRNYQVELLDKAVKKNVIVQLGTGAGKTFIAVLLIKEYTLQLSSSVKENGRRAFFVVDKVALVDQQAEHIVCHTSLKVGKSHGNLNAEIWTSKDAFANFIDQYQIVVLTAQVMVDLLTHGYLSISTVALLIFDECHHALGKGHPFRKIMDFYAKVSTDMRPRILGLTASLINSKADPRALEIMLSALETVLDCSIETTSDLVSVSKYGAKPHETVIQCRNFSSVNEYCKLALTILESAKSFCKETEAFHPTFDMDHVRKPLIESFHRTHSILLQFGPWAAWRVTKLWEGDLRKMRAKIFGSEKQKDFTVLGETTMFTVRRLFEPKMRNIQRLEDLCKTMPSKITRLFSILEAYNPEVQEREHGKVEKLSGIVFVDQRYVAYVMKKIIESIAKWEPLRFGFIKADYIIGNSSGSFENEDSIKQHKRQEDVLRKFRRGDLNLLIATNVLEEGVDIKHCNLVIKYDRPTNFRSYVQSKGRARKAGSNYVVLVDSKDAEECRKDLCDFVEIEKMLLRRARSVHNPVESDNIVLSSVDDLVPPYIVPSTGATLLLSSAIQLVNRYCAKLPSDIFTRLVPQSKLIPVTKNGRTYYLAELILPMNSPLKEPIVLDEPVESKKLAQMRVAYQTCCRLHQIKELNEHLLPTGKEAVLALLDDDPDEFAPAYNARVGSTKRKQLYDKKVARVLNEAVPLKDDPVYLYILELDLIHPLSAEENPRKRKLINPKETEFCFGFLSKKIIPQVPSFPAFLRQGECKVNIVRAKQIFTLNEETLAYLKQFHHYIFRSVLQLTKESLDFQMDEHTPINTLIVPLSRLRFSDGSVQYSIKMDYVKAVVNHMEEMPRVPTDQERRNFKFEPEEWRDRVVMPWYRNVDQPMFFYVAEVLADLSPASDFPDEEYETFNEYFKKKYDLEIYNQEQPLIEVEYTSNRLNLLLPRARSRKAPRPITTPIISAQRQILVPELLDCHPISAHLWNSIAALPSLFYRMNSLLLAEELRVRVMREALGKSEEETSPPEDWMWPPLTYPSTMEEKHSVMVTKLDQLREQKEVIVEVEDAMQTSDEDVDKTDTSFDIGVWDPSLAAHLTTEPSAHTKVDGWLDDTAGLHNTSVIAGGDLSDEEDEDDHALFFDLSKLIKDTTKFAAPRTEIIEETGWGDLPEDVEETPFVLVGPPTNQINLSGLMADLAGTFIPPSVANNGVPAVPGVDRKLLPKQLRELWEDVDEGEDDREKGNGKREDAVDLISFYDDDGSENVKGEEDHEKDSSEEEKEEMDELEEGEKVKIQRDQRAASLIKEQIKKGAVLASPLVDARFSFHSASASRLFSSDGGKGNDPSYGVSPCLLLTALTTSNANDGMNLERLETIGDSFLKYSVTDYLFHTHTDLHEGKLSFARSKEVSNCNLYRLGKKKDLPSLVIGCKFDVQDGWLPPCYIPNVNFKAPNCEEAEIKDRMMEKVLDEDEDMPKEVQRTTGWDDNEEGRVVQDGVETITLTKAAPDALDEMSPLPYNLLTQQYISDKAIADAVEAIIGAHLLSLGPQSTLKMMKWLGLKVLTDNTVKTADPLYHYIDTPANPNFAEQQLVNFFGKFQLGLLEDKIGYRFNNKAFLLQAFTHASYYPNRITGCYQRLEFLGDAVLDYMITRFLFEHEKQYSPGVLTDLRSALVNNTIFASLAVKFDFHKHFVAMCPGLYFMIEKFVKLCQERNFFDANFHSEMYMVTTEDEIDEGQEEDVEVPKAMGDIFESVAGAIYLDCGRDLDVVWRVFYNLMKETIEECCRNPPRSPVRELLEREQERAKFSKLERIMETGKVRVTVEVGAGTTKVRFTGMGRNYRIAKATAAKRALKYLKSLDEEKRKNSQKEKKEKI